MTSCSGTPRRGKGRGVGAGPCEGSSRLLEGASCGKPAERRLGPCVKVPGSVLARGHCSAQGACKT
jgi:hypothetical protein